VADIIAGADSTSGVAGIIVGVKMKGPEGIGDSGSHGVAGARQ